MNAKLKVVPAAPAGASLEDLGRRFLNLKAIEDAAKKERADIATQIAALVDNGQQAGTSNAEVAELKIKVVRKLDYKIDMEGLGRVFNQIPVAVRDRLIRTKYELEVKELKYLENNEPELYRLASAAVIIKPANPSVTVE
jgi:hypothetical protein